MKNSWALHIVRISILLAFIVGTFIFQPVAKIVQAEGSKELVASASVP
jgi:hypothetical protein